MDSLNSWIPVASSWTVFSGVVVLGWWYYKRNGKLQRVGRQRRGSVEVDRSDRGQSGSKARHKKPKVQDQDTSEVGSSDAPETDVPQVRVGENKEKGLEPKKKGNKKYQKLNLAESSAISVEATTTRSLDQEDKDEMDAEDFARQMTKAKAGTSLAAPAKSNQRVRTKKPSKLNGNFDDFASDNMISGASSNTGADADDDMSSAPSPEFGAASASTYPTGVADMLEIPGAGPSSLRITESQTPQRTPQQKKAKVDNVETKKQRQARVRREREKEIAKETEAQRRALEERQRRIAREAEGRPAKNGNGWTYASGLPANAWTSGTPTISAETKEPSNAPMLDTREEGEQPLLTEDKAISTSSSDDAKSSANGTVGSSTTTNSIDAVPTAGRKTGNGWANGLPSEEEQIRMFKQQTEDSEWTTVPATKRNKHRAVTEDRKAEQISREASDFDVNI